MRTLRRLPGTPAAMALLMLFMSGCSGIGAVVDRTILPTEDSPGERWHMALQMLGSGDERQAAELFEELRDTPGYAERSKHMLEQIRRPIHRYFPDNHFNVRLRAGQTLSALSRHYLDDPLKFFALARYNGIAAPNRVAAGQLIRIPLTEHASRVRIAEMGSPDADDPIDHSSGIEASTGAGDAVATGSHTGESEGEDAGEGDRDGDSSDDGSTAAERTDTEATLSDADRARIRRYYREATKAFQQQDLDRTLWYCGRVLDMEPEHQHCLSYRDRAEALQRQLDRIQQEQKTAAGE